MNVRGALILLFVVGVCSSGMNLNFVRNAVTRAAVCNDGSPAGYYFSRGTGLGLNKWVFFLEGGYACFTLQDCLKRAAQQPELTSSKTWGKTYTMPEGILSDSPRYSPTFYNANKVFIPYCSSDYWVGTRAANGTQGLDAWNFLAVNIIRAVVEDVIAYQGLNSPRSEILITGCSAGGKGVFANTDRIRSYLPFTPAKFLSYNDQGWNADFPISSGNYLNQFMIGNDLWGILPNPRCAVAHPPEHQFLCMFGQFAIPYFATPTLFHINQYDPVQLMLNCNCTVAPGNATQLQWLEDQRTHQVASFLAQRAPHTIFSPACVGHCVSMNSTFSQTKVKGVSMADYLNKFWLSNGNLPNLIDTCTGFACGPGCPAMVKQVKHGFNMTQTKMLKAY